MLKFRLIPAEQRPTATNIDPPITVAPAHEQGVLDDINERPTSEEPDYAEAQRQQDSQTPTNGANTAPTSTTTTNSGNTTTAITTTNDPAPDSSENGLGSKIPDLLEFFPKSLRNRTRILLLSIKDNVKLGENNRVIYTNMDGSENQGSSLIALLHYIVSPLPPSKKQTRPYDLLDFAKILEKTATPSNAYGNGKKAILEALLSDGGGYEKKRDAASRREDRKNKKSDRNGWLYIYGKKY